MIMISLGCSLAWLCSTCDIATFCSALAVMLEKKGACFVMAEKSDTAV